jgi:uncharacterized OB-fold protein
VRRDAATAAFFDGTARGELLLWRCRACPDAELQGPQARACPDCASPDLEPVPAAGGASLVSWAVVHERPRPGQEPGRTVVAISQLDEGPWWWSQLVDADPDQLRAGTRLVLDFVTPVAPGGDTEPAEPSEVVPVFRLAP